MSYDDQNDLQQHNQKPDQPQSKNGPEFSAYNVREGNNGKNYWHNIGFASTHKDGKGIDLRLHAVPVDGHITLRDRAHEFKQRQNRLRASQEHDPAPSQSPKLD